MGFGFVEGMELATPAELLLAQKDIDLVGIEGDSGASDRRQDASPVGVGAGERSLHQHGGRYGVADAVGFLLGARLLDGEPDNVLYAFAVQDDLLGQG